MTKKDVMMGTQSLRMDAQSVKLKKGGSALLTNVQRNLLSN